MFKQLEGEPRGERHPTPAVLDRLKLNAGGLIPAIAQQHDTGEVLMLAWMNREALDETLATGRVCYYSRSRQALWRKGEQSGQVQQLHSLHLDCDGDTLLLKVDQTGPACHTGRRSCFYLQVGQDTVVVTSDPEIAPETLYGKDTGQ
ncbi:MULTISPECIES: phosphoribosyl-AMP cyclohydrolase [unclassified Thioalkalivibrio]|uniref:phosphoribosyl-AMP cyclohydrolase n=1 Tax=unclassified Thioalkalivibrio TaxID=2621013 RepID=UPI00037B2075|nr:MULTISPECIES: phosphoribosyl-AMP cyclohydrolase [unclassified Thioalkalivibrio]